MTGHPLEATRFLANMMLLEDETARHCQRLAGAALDAGDTELEAFFLSLAETARLDVAEARSDGIGISQATLTPSPLGDCLLALRSPAERNGFSAQLGMHCAMACALSLVRRSHDYYAKVADETTSHSLHGMAAGFAHERARHIADLEHWITRLTL